MKKQILLTAMLLITAATACAQFNIKIGSGKTFRKDTIDQAVLMVQKWTAVRTHCRKSVSRKP